MKDKEMVEVMRLKERIGGYHKYVDNACINQPDPTSSHFISDAERFDKDHSVYDKKLREVQHKQKMEMIEKKRYFLITKELKNLSETCRDGSLWIAKKSERNKELTTAKIIMGQERKTEEALLTM